MNKRSIAAIIWSSTVLVYVLPFIRWGDGLNWQFDNLSLLNIFPLLGLWAFAQMWLHYAVGVIKRRYPDDFNYEPWYKYSASAVLALIFLHPALLIVQGFRNEFTSIDYVGSDNAMFIYIGFIALFGFILYDIADKFQETKFWSKNFEVIKVISIFAMLGIFYHSLNLGQHLQSGWLRAVWLVMLVAFIGFVIDSYTYKSK